MSYWSITLFPDAARPVRTQTVTLIALKRGGVPLALLTLLLWVFPAALMMGAFSFVVNYIDTKDIQNNLFSYIAPCR